MRRLFTLATVLVVLIPTRGFAVPARPALPTESTLQRPNVVLILSDYMGMRDASTDLLFDVEADLGERHDLTYKHHEVVVKLRQLLAQWETSVRN